jgi:hypothetical protein
VNHASPIESADFDVREFARSAHGSLRDDLDLGAFATAGFGADVVAALAALGALEGATMAHLRNVLVTPTHKDARVTAFLVTWAYEKYWIADALRSIVDASSGDSDSATVDAPADAAAAARATSLGARTRRDAASAGRGPVRRALAGFAQGSAVVGAHLALGLVADLVLRVAYERAVAGSGSVALAVVVRRILDVKSRHARFFDEEMRRRFRSSQKSVRLARREVRRTTWPLASAALAPAERERFLRFAFGGPDDAGEGLHGAVRAPLDGLERDLAALPGMDAGTAAVVRAGLAARHPA